MPAAAAGRLRRLAEEQEESGLHPEGTEAVRATLMEQIDIALRPPVHERRVPSGGTILDPASDPTTWGPGTQLDITRTPVGQQPLAAVRRFADGISSWLVRRADGTDEWMVFDRPAGSERDLVVQADVYEATIVQRHPAGSVRVVGSFGVLRWGGFTWHHEPPVGSWIDVVTACPANGDPEILEAMLEFAVHDLGSMGIGSLLVYRPDPTSGPAVEERLPKPPPLRIRRPAHLAPLRHALAQVDGAAVFDTEGVESVVPVLVERAARHRLAAIAAEPRRYGHDRADEVSANLSARAGGPGYSPVSAAAAGTQREAASPTRLMRSPRRAGPRARDEALLLIGPDHVASVGRRVGRP